MNYSVFVTPKNMLEDAEVDEQQLRALRSWFRLQSPPVRVVVLITQRQSIESFRSLAQVDETRVVLHRLNRADADTGLPYFDELLSSSASMQLATGSCGGDAASPCERTHVAVMTNADVIAHDGVVAGLCAARDLANGQVDMSNADFLAIAARWDVARADARAVESDGENAVRRHGTLHTAGGVDLWAYPIGGEHRNPYTVPARSAVPPLVRGRSRCDNWLVSTAKANGVYVVDITPVAFIAHVLHDYKLRDARGGSNLTTHVRAHAAGMSVWDGAGSEARVFGEYNRHLSLRYGSYVPGDGVPLDAHATVVAQHRCLAALAAHDPLVSMPYTVQQCTFPLVADSSTRTMPFYEHLAPPAASHAAASAGACPLCAVLTDRALLCRSVVAHIRRNSSAPQLACYAHVTPRARRVRAAANDDMPSYSPTRVNASLALFRSLVYSRTRQLRGPSVDAQPTAAASFVHAVDNTVIVLCASDSHLPLLQNMMCQLQRLGLAERVVVAPFDLPTLRLCRRHGWLAIDPLVYYANTAIFAKTLTARYGRAAVRSILDASLMADDANATYTLALPCHAMHSADARGDGVFGKQLYSCYAKLKVLVIQALLASTNASLLMLDVDIWLRRDPVQWLRANAERFATADFVVQGNGEDESSPNRYDIGGCVNSGLFWVRHSARVVRMHEQLALQFLRQYAEDRELRSAAARQGNQSPFSFMLCGNQHEAETWCIGSHMCWNPAFEVRTDFVESYELVNGITWQLRTETAFIQHAQDADVVAASGGDRHMRAWRENFTRDGVAVHFNWIVGLHRKEYAQKAAGGWLLTAAGDCLV